MYQQHHKQLQIRRVQTRLLQTHTHQSIQDTDEKQAQLKVLSCQRERLLPKANQVWEVAEYRRPLGSGNGFNKPRIYHCGLLLAIVLQMLT